MLSDIFGLRSSIVTEHSERLINGGELNFFDGAPLIATFLPVLYLGFIYSPTHI